MVIQNHQRIAVVIVCHPELTLEIRLPHYIALRFLKAGEGLPFHGFFRADTTVSVQNVVDRLDAGKIGMPCVGQYCVDRLGTPAGVVGSERKDQLFHSFRCPGRCCMRTPATVCKGLLRFVPLYPLATGTARDAELTAQSAEISAAHGSFCKFFSTDFAQTNV